jgi:uncharacterized membrane protein
MKTLIIITVLFVLLCGLLAYAMETIVTPVRKSQLHNEAVQMVLYIEVLKGKQMSRAEFEQATAEIYADLVEGEQE